MTRRASLVEARTDFRPFLRTTIPYMAATLTSTSIDLDYRPSYLAAGIASLAVLVLYLITLAPSTAMWDTS